MDRDIIIAKTMLKLAGVSLEELNDFETDIDNIINRSRGQKLSEENLHKALGKHLVNFAQKSNLRKKDEVRPLLEIVHKTDVLHSLSDEAKKIWDPLLRGFGLRLPS